MKARGRGVNVTGNRPMYHGQMVHAKFALVIAVMAISFAALFFRGAAPTHPLIQAAVRLAIASILLLPWLVRVWGTEAFSRRVIRTGVVCGFWYAVHFGAWVTSLTMTTVTASVTLPIKLYRLQNVNYISYRLQLRILCPIHVSARSLATVPLRPPALH